MRCLPLFIVLYGEAGVSELQIREEGRVPGGGEQWHGKSRDIYPVCYLATGSVLHCVEEADEHSLFYVYTPVLWMLAKRVW